MSGTQKSRGLSAWEGSLAIGFESKSNSSILGDRTVSLGTLEFTASPH